MFCTNCGKPVEAATKFCPHCGAHQVAEMPPQPQPTAPPLPPQQGFAQAFPASPPGSTASSSARAGTSRTGLWAGAAALVLAAVGAVGYWGWSNKVAGEEAAQKVMVEEQARKSASEDATRRLAEAEQQRLAAEKAAEAAEITAARALLDKHIAAEEAQAQANQQGGPAQPQAKGLAQKR